MNGQFLHVLSTAGNVSNLVIGTALVIISGLMLVLGRPQARDAILAFYRRPPNLEGVEFRWFERRPNPNPAQALFIACAVCIAGVLFGLVMIVLGLRG
jgi:predicted PurR-regulated permease PerM